MSGALVLVGTPIGNLGDLSPRALEALQGADLVACEDTRRTGRLLHHLGVTGVPMTVLNEHTEYERAGDLAERVAAGQRVVVVSDAGMPGVSDPGERLVRRVLDAGLAVEVVPGPTALVTALVLSGLATDRFVFEGFLPRRGRAREDRLAALSAEERTIVLFLSPHRAAVDAADLARALGSQRSAVLARELTKLHEEVRPTTLGELARRTENGVRGELTLVIAGAPEPSAVTLDDAELAERVRELIATGLAKKQAIAAVAKATDRPKREVYQAVVDAGS